MPAYLVRLIENRDLVGIVVAEEVDTLLVIIDEYADGGACEFVELPDGGIMWGSPAIAVPIDAGDDNATEIPGLPLHRAELSGSWWGVVYGQTDEQWTRFVPENPLQPKPPAPRRPWGPGQVIPMRRKRS